MKQLLTLLAIAIATQTVAQQNQKSDEIHSALVAKVDTTKQGWTKGGLLNIGVNEGLLENWASGGERMSLALNGQFDGFLTCIKSNLVWENTLNIHYGLSYVASNHFVPRKLDDRVDYSTRYGIQAKKWTTSTSKFKRSTYLMGLFRMQSQLSKGYNYSQDDWQHNPISEFLSPAYFTLALGAEFRPNANFSVFLSPVAGKLTEVNPKYTTFGSAFGVEQGKTSKMELGAYLTVKYKNQFTKNIFFLTRFDLYSNYLAKNKTQPDGIVHKDSPGNIDILWDNILTLKINKFVGATFGLTMIYDNDQPGQKTKNNDTEYGPLKWWQLKQVLNIGFSYKLN